MAHDFYDNFSTAREVFETASEAIGVDLKKICFEENEMLDLTEFTQPAILTAEIAMFRSIVEVLDINACLFAGHSLGEYTALSAGTGGMAAVIFSKIEIREIENIVREIGVEIANYNSPGQIVISGAKTDIIYTVEKLKKYFPNIETILLNVSAPFHSSLMKTIEPEFSDYLMQFNNKLYHEKSRQVVSNFTGQLHSPENLFLHLVRQISSPVRWVDNMRLLINHGHSIIEIGPNKPLSKFFSSLGCNITSYVSLRSLQKNPVAGKL